MIPSPFLWGRARVGGERASETPAKHVSWRPPPTLTLPHKGEGEWPVCPNDFRSGVRVIFRR